MARINYDQIAHLYDEPVRDKSLDVNLLDFLGAHPDIKPEQAWILDVGCGTGKQLSANRARFPTMAMAGLDRYCSMLRIARQRCASAGWVHGDGMALPFATASFHYVTSQLSYHHIEDKTKLLAEIFRTLKPRGRFVMTNVDPWAMEDWFPYKYFPAARKMDERDLLPVERFVEHMRQAGFQAVDAQRTREFYPYDNPRDLLAHVSQRHRASYLMAMPDEAYNEGIRRLQHDAQAGNKKVESSFVLVTVCGDKP